MKIPPVVKDFQGLVGFLIEEQHNGVAYDMARSLGLSPGLVYQWASGMVRRPSDSSIAKMVAFYDLDAMDILALTIPGRLAKPISGGSGGDNAPRVSWGVLSKVRGAGFYHRLCLWLGGPQIRPAFAC